MLTADRWQRVQEVFDNAADLPASDQAAYLDRACTGDAALRAAVERLLRADQAGCDLVEEVVRRETVLLHKSNDPLAAKGKVGKFEVLAPIGEGGFGVVYKGRDPMLQRFVAIKACNSQDKKVRQRFFREAQIAAGLAHPNIVTVHDLGIHEGVPYLVQEYLSGEDLDRKIGRREPHSLAERLDILIQVAQGLAFAHAHGVIHRDVKPGNVRVLESGVVKLMDFGIARLLDESSRLTSHGMTMGTVGYLSPEQLRGQEPSRQSDVFAFGVLAYELLAFTRPFAGETFSDVAVALFESEPRALVELVPDCPVELAVAIERCLVRDVAHRSPDFTAVLAELGAFSGDGRPRDRSRPGQTPPGPPADSVGTTAPSGPAVFGAVNTTAGQDTPSRRQSAAEQPLTPPPPVLAPSRGRLRLLAAIAGLTLLATAAIWQMTQTNSRSQAAATAAAAIAELPPRRLTPGERGLRLRAVQERLTRPLAAPAQPTPTVTAALAAGRSSTTAADAEIAVAGSLGPAEEVQAPGLDIQPDAAIVPPSSFVPSGPTPTWRELIPVKPGPGVVPPQLLSQPPPKYPAGAIRELLEGRVIVAVLVDAYGRVREAEVEMTTDPQAGFGPAAVAAAHQATFVPATASGQTRAMWTELVYAFRLR